MKPGLLKHVGCDIIDINPGPGVWSSKLHDFLKPRSHILMEPEHELYGPILKPLVDAEGSTYQLVPKSGVIWDHLNKVLTPEYLPHQPLLDRGDPRLEEPNDTLLFVANLGYYPKKPYRGFVSLTLLTIHQMMAAIRSHSLFHKYGLVRMLIWTHDEEKKTLIPRTITLRKKFTIEGEVACKSIVEVASSTLPATDQRRDYELDKQSMDVVLKKMDATGIKTPEGRHGALQEEGLERSEGVEGQGEANKAMRSFYHELHVLKERFAAGEFTKYVEELVGEDATDEAARKKAARKKARDDKATKIKAIKENKVPPKIGRPAGSAPKRPETPEYTRLKTLAHRFGVVTSREKKFSDLVAEQKALTAAKLAPPLSNPAKASALTKRLALKHEEWIEKVDAIHSTSNALFWLHHDNDKALDQNVPILYWDRRPYEPLQTHTAEFQPRTNLALLDFTPQSLWPVLRKDYPGSYDVLDYLLSNFFVLPTQSVTRGLESCAPGAVDWLVPKCPSLTDPARGGCLDLELLSVRCLTQEMLREIVEAWVIWPFRPDRLELLGKLGSTPHDPYAETE